MGLATREIHGLRISIRGGNDGLLIHSGRCRDFDDQHDITVGRSETIVVLPDRVGLGGLDTWTMQPRTSYAVYLVRQGNDIEGMLSRAFDPNSADPPAFPNDGSLVYRRIGAVATDGQGRIIAAEQEGDGNDRSYRYAAGGIALEGGTATEFSPIDLAPFFHRHARGASLRVQPGNGVPVTIARDAQGTGSTRIETLTTLPFEAVGGDHPTVAYYRNAGAGGSTTISVLGFEETL